MGKGDKKTRKGKISMGSFGKTRPHKIEKSVDAELSKPSAKKKKEEEEKVKEAKPKAATTEKAKKA